MKNIIIGFVINAGSVGKTLENRSAFSEKDEYEKIKEFQIKKRKRLSNEFSMYFSSLMKTDNSYFCRACYCPKSTTRGKWFLQYVGFIVEAP